MAEQEMCNCLQCGEHDWSDFNKMVSVIGQEGHIPEMIVEAKCLVCSHKQIVIGPCSDPVAVRAIKAEQ